ncbi:MAG: hypothetical protein WCQ50_01535 [Spirochaetota bacterium]
MVRGLDVFRRHFDQFRDSYVLIGGTAASLVLEESGLPFRATKDLDIVLSVEAMSAGFVSSFWEFIRSGGYENRQRSTGKRLFYRFYEPTEAAYPEMPELFSRVPDALDIAEASYLTPIPTADEASSLSAILLEPAYYEFIHAGKRVVEGLSIVGEDRLIPLKARAWMDLDARLRAGESIDSRDVRKHRNDVLRLIAILDPSRTLVIPDSIRGDLRAFVAGLETAKDINMKALGLGGGFDSHDRFFFIPVGASDVLQELWRQQAIGFFLKQGLIDAALAESMLGWMHSGFSVERSLAPLDFVRLYRPGHPPNPSQGEASCQAIRGVLIPWEKHLEG